MNEMKNIAEIDQNCLQLWTSLLGSTTDITQTLNKRMRQYTPLTLAKFDVLMAINRASDDVITMSELSRMLMVSNANMTGMTKRLVKDGFVRKWALPTDRRVYGVALTGEGKRVLQETMTIHHEWIEELIGGVRREDISDMIKKLDNLKASVKKISKKEE